MSNTDFGRTDESGSAGSLKDAALDAVGGVKQEAASFAASAQERLSDGADRQMDTAAQGLHVFAGAIRTAAEELAKQDQSVAGSLVKRAADGLEDLSRSLSSKDPEQLLDAVRQFGRDNPVAFAGASVLIGVALGRVARSSASDGGSAGTTSQSRPSSGNTSLSAGNSGGSPGQGVSGYGATPGLAASPTSSTGSATSLSPTSQSPTFAGAGGVESGQSANEKPATGASSFPVKPGQGA